MLSCHIIFNAMRQIDAFRVNEKKVTRFDTICIFSSYNLLYVFCFRRKNKRFFLPLTASKAIEFKKRIMKANNL